MSELINCLPVSTAMGAQLWLIDLMQTNAHAYAHKLADWEHERAERFRFERDARRYRAGHVALRQLLGQHLNVPPEQVPLETTPLGKPFIQGHAVHFNLSHSENWALVALHCQQVIGVDIELHHSIPEIETLSRQNYTYREWAELQESADPLDAFLTCWTRKEACLKALGSGFSVEAASFEAGVGTQPQTVRITPPEKGLCTMTVCSLDFSREREQYPHLPQLYGAIALIAPDDADRVF